MSGILLRLATLSAAISVIGCSDSDEPIVLPDPAQVEAWFEGNADVSVENRRLRIDAVMDPDHLARGGLLWQRATPYFYLFNTHVRQVLLDFPSLEGVDVVLRAVDGDTLATVTVHRETLSVYEWDRAVAYTSRAQSEGTDNPGFVVDLLRWAEDRVENSYTRPDR